MKFELIVDLMAAIGTMGSALYTYRTVTEMKNQRIANSMPELFIENIDNIFILGSANSHLSIPFVISQNELPKDPFAYDDDIYLTLGNIGVAPAKNIRIGWNCDYSKILSMIEASNVVGYFQINGRTITTTGGGGSFRFLIRNPERDFIKYIKNSTSDAESLVKIRIPHLYIFLAIIYQMCGMLFFQNRTTQQGLLQNYFPDDFPKLYADIEYDDLNGVHYYKKFKLGVNGYLRFTEFPVMNQRVGEMYVYHSEMPTAKQFYERIS